MNILGQLEVMTAIKKNIDTHAYIVPIAWFQFNKTKPNNYNKINIEISNTRFVKQFKKQYIAIK